jgi:hypothetical protein
MWSEQLTQRSERGQSAGGILLAVAAAQADPTDNFIVDYDGETADENRESAIEAPLDSECFIAGKRRAIGRLVEKVRGAPVSRGSEGLVPSDLWSGYSRAIHTFEREGIAAIIDDANRFQRPDFFRLAQRGRYHVARFLQLQLECTSHWFFPAMASAPAYGTQCFSIRDIRF